MFARNLYHDFHAKGEDIDAKMRLLHIIASNITINDKKAVINYQTKYVAISMIKNSGIEEIESFERFSLYQDSIIKIPEKVDSTLRRG